MTPIRKLEFKTQSYHFSIAGWLLFLSIALIGALIGLGIWQVHRAKEKTVWLEMMKAKSTATAHIPTDLSAVADFSHIQLTGQLDNTQQLLLDNKFHQHRPGFHVLTAMKMPGEARWVLLNRGWVPRGYKRTDLPKLAPVNGRQTLSGIVYYPKKRLLLLSHQEDPSRSWPRIMQRLDFAAFERVLKRPLMPFVLILDDKQSATMLRDWQPVIMMPARHYAYAFQWFALALTLLVIVIATNVRKR